MDQIALVYPNTDINSTLALSNGYDNGCDNEPISGNKGVDRFHSPPNMKNKSYE